MLTLGSLFDGIGGWLLAAQHAGIKPLWRCEIDEYPRAVSEYHFPDVDSYGDIRKVHGNEIAPVDIICAGSPCQNLSVAGNRKGLQGSESSLFYESIRILREMRDATNGKYPGFFVWENVVGAFSGNHGNDFRAVLSEIGQTKIPMPESGKWGGCGVVRVPLCDIAWRTLDAQYWGVPQRRRRIFLVADFATEKRCAAEVLFVEQSVSRDTAESITSREEIAAVAGDSAQASSWCIAGNIINRKDKNGGHHLGVDKDVSFTLNTIDRHAVFAEGDAYCLQGSMIGRKEKNGPQGSGVNKNVSFTLNTIDRHAVFAEGEKTYSVQAIGHIVESEKSSTLAARDYKSPRNFVEYQKEVPLYDISHLSDGVREIPKGAVNTLAARMGTGGGNVAVLNEADRQETDDVRTVRRLTVTECERLQGLPDGYTDVPLNGKPASDARRYKAIGNGMAQPCADFVLQQIVKFQSIR